MADKELWTTFMKTGSVADYLNYKGIHENIEKEKVGEEQSFRLRFLSVNRNTHVFLVPKESIIRFDPYKTVIVFVRVR